MKAYAISNVGYVRKINEDSFLSLPRYGVFAVADGMGGHQAGEIASKLAIQTLEEKSRLFWECRASKTADVLVEEIHNANLRIMQESISLRIQKGMGTTLSALIIKGAKAVIGHVGDSRVYLWRNQTLTQLTEDHSVVAELVRIGQLTEEEAKDHPNRNMLSRALGMGEDLKVDCLQVVVNEGDVFLLTSDGVTNLINDEEIARLFTGEVEGPSEMQPWQTHLEFLSQMILARGAYDNYTLVCCVVEPEDLNDQPTYPTHPPVESRRYRG